MTTHPSLLAENLPARAGDRERLVSTTLGTPRLRVVLPAFNEQDALPPLLAGIQRALDDFGLEYLVIVVDDGSTDATAEVAAEFLPELPLSVVRHAQNQGLGRTLRTGFLAALNACRPGDIVITMDADNSHPPYLIRRLVQSIREGCDVAIASRFHADARVVGVSWDRKLLSVLARWMFKLCFPIPGVRDYTCGYRAYRAEVLQQAMAQHGDAFVSETGFSCMVDVLLKLRHRAWVMGEVPLMLRYDQKPGASKMHVLRTVRQSLFLILRRMFAP